MHGSTAHAASVASQRPWLSPQVELPWAFQEPRGARTMGDGRGLVGKRDLGSLDEDKTPLRGHRREKKANRRPTTKPLAFFSDVALSLHPA